MGSNICVSTALCNSFLLSSIRTLSYFNPSIAYSKCQQSTCTKPPFDPLTVACPPSHYTGFTTTTYGTKGCTTEVCNLCSIMVYSGQWMQGVQLCFVHTYYRLCDGDPDPNSDSGVRRLFNHSPSYSAGNYQRVSICVKPDSRMSDLLLVNDQTM